MSTTRHPDSKPAILHVTGPGISGNEGRWAHVLQGTHHVEWAIAEDPCTRKADASAARKLVLNQAAGPGVVWSPASVQL